MTSIFRTVIKTFYGTCADFAQFSLLASNLIPTNSAISIAEKMAKIPN